MDRVSVSFERALTELEQFCREHDWRGSDCYDGLNSRWFRSSPLYRSRLARMVWTQVFKRSPLDLRPPAGVDAEDNPKALALFVLGMAARESAGMVPRRRDEMQRLAQRLVARQGEAGGWGYPFDWQSRAFFAPRDLPNIVATSFSCLALFAAHRMLPERLWVEAAGRGCRFVADRLATEYGKDDLFFSYVPGDRSRIYNATLLGARLLAEGGVDLVEPSWIDLAFQAARCVVKSQADDGSWPYGPLLRHRWTDSFHTGYNLTALEAISTFTGATEFDGAIARGYSFYRNRFFREDSAPRYYPHRTYPIDIHSAAVAIETFLAMRRFDSLAERWAAMVARWTIDTMRDERRGFFYFQKHRLYTIRIPYMRWSQAWMYRALSLLTSRSAIIRRLSADAGARTEAGLRDLGGCAS